MKKITEKQILTCVVLGGLVLILVVYFLVFKAYNDKADAMVTANAALNTRVNELKKFYEDVEKNKVEIESMQNQILEWLDKFPADVKEEDIIVTALDTEKNALVAYTNINIADREALYTIPTATTLLSGIENLNQDLIFVKRITSYVNTTDYLNMKNIVRTLNESKNRLSIQNFNYSFNEETGLLDGTIEVAFYSICGTGKEYIPQVLPDYIEGLSDLFGNTTVKPKAD